MTNDEFTQKVPSIDDIMIDSGVVYLKEKCKMRKSVNAATADIVLDFINANNSTQIKKFIVKYGPLDGYNNKELQKNTKYINGYTPIIVINYFMTIQSEIKGYFDIINKKTIRIFSGFKDKELREEADNVFSWYVEDLNSYIRARDHRIAYNETYKFYDQVRYISLKHVIFCKTAEIVTGIHPPKRCEKCKERWVSTSKSNVKYCDICRKTASKQKIRNNKKSDVKEQTYLKVYGHFYTKFSRGNDQSKLLDESFDYEFFKEQALLIKTNSYDFYKDLDELCKKHCKCSKCKNGIASYFRNKTEELLK